MKDSPIFFSDDRWERLDADIKEIKSLLRQLLDNKSEKPAQQEEILSARDVARLLGIDIASVYARCVKGTIPHFKIGKQYKFRQSDIYVLMEKGDLAREIDVDEYVNRYLQKINIKG